MAYDKGMITAPVSIADVQRALGNGKRDLGTLCTDTSINKWARYKPERSSSISFISHGTMWGETNTRKNNHFGLAIPFCTNDMMNGLIYDIITQNDPVSYVDNNIWAYNRPRGGTHNEVFRLTDFVRTPNDDTDLTPSNLQGYNHRAPQPFDVTVMSDGLAERYDGSRDFWYYEINAQTSNKLDFIFTNNVGDDIHLQDLIDINGSYESGVAWRPVIQVFKDSGTGTSAWYNRGSILASNGDIEVAGAAITTDVGSISRVTLNLNQEPFFNGSYANYYFHVCVGIGCCRQDFTKWKDNNNSLFLPPMSGKDFYKDFLSFYFMIKVVSAQVNRIHVTEIQWMDGGTAQWKTVSSDNSTFEVGVNSVQQIRLKMTFTNVTGLTNLYFVKQYGNPPSGKTALYVSATEQIKGVTTNTVFLQPTNSGWSTVDYEAIGTGDTTLYATLMTSELEAGTVATYRLKGESGGSQYDDMGMITIRKRRTI